MIEGPIYEVSKFEAMYLVVERRTLISIFTVVGNIRSFRRRMSGLQDGTYGYIR